MEAIALGGFIAAGLQLRLCPGYCHRRFSGWRYDLPADWVPYFYFGIGFAEINTCIALLFNAQENIHSERTVEDTQSKGVLPGLIIRISLCPHWRTAVACKGHRFSALCGSISFTLSAQITSIPARRLHLKWKCFYLSKIRFTKGRLLYPRFISAMKRVSRNPWPAYETRSYPRLGFCS